MGSNQSAPISNEKLVIERLQALELKDQADNDYVHVDEKVVSKPIRYKAPWTTLSVDEVEHWEHELLQDPKNRLVFMPDILSALTDTIDSHSLLCHPQILNPSLRVEQPI
jgi:hypothetical protein